MTQSKAFQRKTYGPGRQLEVLDHPVLLKCKNGSLDYSRDFCPGFFLTFAGCETIDFQDLLCSWVSLFRLKNPYSFSNIVLGFH